MEVGLVDPKDGLAERLRDLEMWKVQHDTWSGGELKRGEEFRVDVQHVFDRIDKHLETAEKRFAAMEKRFIAIDRKLLILTIGLIILTLVGPDGVVMFVRSLVLTKTP